MKAPAMNRGETDRRAPSIKHQPRSQRSYFDVAIGSVCLAGADTGGAYCLLEARLAPGMSVPRHTHTREDETYYVLAGELEVIVGDGSSFSRQGIPSSRRATLPINCAILATLENHYLLVFSPSGFEEFLKATAVPAPDNAPAPTEPPAVAVRGVLELAADYAIRFG